MNSTPWNRHWKMLLLENLISMKKTKIANSPSEQKQLLSDELLIAILSIFYFVGVIGLSLANYKETFISLSTYHLLLTFVVLSMARKTAKNEYFLFSVLLVFTGLLVEIIGTKTGLLFGSYSYGDSLGYKVFGVPFIIGINWATMVVCSSTFANRFHLKIIYKAFIASAVMTLLDLFIEPIAIAFDYWSWEGDEVPFYNYLCWFVVSYPLNYLYLRWNLAEKNKVALAVLVLLSLFFVVLNCF